MDNNTVEEARNKWIEKKRKAQVQTQLMNEQLYLKRVMNNDKSLYSLCESVMNTKGVGGLNELIRIASSMLHHISAGGNGTWD